MAMSAYPVSKRIVVKRRGLEGGLMGGASSCSSLGVSSSGAVSSGGGSSSKMLRCGLDEVIG